MPNKDYDRIAELIRYLSENATAQPSLNDMADAVGISPFHLQRTFRRWVGVSPKRFVQYLTAQYAKERLRLTPSLLDATLDVGLSSPSRLHELFVNILAMTPAEYRDGGANLLIRFAVSPSPFGDCLLAITDKGICFLAFIDPNEPDKALKELRAEWPKARFEEAKNAVRSYIDKIFSCDTRASSDFTLHLNSTNFQLQVWQALLRIPAGSMLTYGDLAQRTGHPRAARAIGTAVGANPVSYLIPCHRVIRSTGVIGEYRWGSTRKRAILGWEAATFAA